MKNNMLLTIWVAEDQEEEFIEDITNVEAPFRKMGCTSAGSVRYQMSCISVGGNDNSIEIAYWQNGYLAQIGFMLEDIWSYQISSDC